MLLLLTSLAFATTPGVHVTPHVTPHMTTPHVNEEESHSTSVHTYRPEPVLPNFIHVRESYTHHPDLTVDSGDTGVESPLAPPISEAAVGVVLLISAVKLLLLVWVVWVMWRRVE